MNDEKLEKFIAFVEKEWNWRQRELTFFKQALASANPYQKNAVSRSGLLLLYSHWEGFIKRTSQEFLGCFANADIRRAPKHILAAHLAKVYDIMSTKNDKSSSAHISLNYISEGATVCSSIHKIINTESNLNSNNLKKNSQFRRHEL